MIQQVTESSVDVLQAEDLEPTAPGKRRTRVVLIDHTAQFGGGELALLSLVGQLDKTRYEPIVVLSSSGPLEEELRKIVETHVLPLDPRVLTTRKDSVNFSSVLRPRTLLQSVVYVKRLTDFIRSYSPDLVHTNSLKSDVLGGLAAKLAGVPLIWHVRDRIDKDYLPSSAAVVFRWLCRTMPDVVIANSRATLETIRLPASKPCAVVYSGLDIDQYIRHRDTEKPETWIETSEERRNDGREIKLGLVGRLTPWKGQDVFLRAAKIVQEQYPGARFLMYGSAMFGEQAYEESLHKLTRELDLEGVVRFMGFEKDVQQAIGKLDVLVHASTTPEPFGQVIVQGMAAGKPVVASEGGGASEIVTHGLNGLLVERGNPRALAAAICQLLANPREAREMAMRGRQRAAEHFTIQQTTRKVEGLYDRLRSHRPGDDAKLRILFYNTTALVSGAEVVLLNILSRLNKKTFSFELACPRGALSERAEALGVRVIEIPELKARFTGNPLRLLRYLTSIVSVARQLRHIVRQARPDIIHANSIRAGITSTLATLGQSPRIQWHVHDMLPAHPITALVRLLAATSRKSSFLAVSEATERDFCGHFLRRAIGRKSTAILNGVNIEHYRTEWVPQSALRQELGIAEGQFCIGHVGQITPRKDQLGMIQAFSKVVSRMPDAVLLIIGKPVFEGGDLYYQQVQQAVKDLSLEGKVRFLGHRNEVARLMHGFDLLVMNSVNDPCPLTVLEAMAAGIPILASDVDGIPELITDGKTGWLSPPRNPARLAQRIIEIAAKPEEERRRIGSNARQHTATHHSLERYMEQFSTFCLSGVEGRPRDARRAAAEVPERLHDVAS